MYHKTSRLLTSVSSVIILAIAAFGIAAFKEENPTSGDAPKHDVTTPHLIPASSKLRVREQLANAAYRAAPLAPDTTGSSTSMQTFGTGAGSQTSQTGSTSFLPNPTSGTTWARAGAIAPSAPIVLSNTSNPLGTTGSFVRGVASSTTSVTKFSPWVGYTASPQFYTSFKVLFGDASAGITAASGTWSFFQGSGTMYSDANNFSSAQVFSGLDFTYGPNGTVSLAYHGGSSASTAGLTATSFAQGVVHTVEIVGNNQSSGSISYVYRNTSSSVAPQKFDLYIDGTLIGDDLSEATLPAGNNIDSGAFIGFSSTSNIANIFVDDLATFNAIPSVIGAETTTTSITSSSGGTSTYGTQVTFTATVTGQATVTGGTANWTVGATTCTDLLFHGLFGSNVSVDSTGHFFGTTNPILTPGDHIVCANYFGDGSSFGPSTGTIIEHVLALVPSVATSNPQFVVFNGAKLLGSTNPNAAVTTGYFRYDTVNPGTCNDTFGTKTPDQNLGSGTTNVGWQESLTSLTPVTSYFYCAIAKDSAGTGFGNVLQFTTPPPPTTTVVSSTNPAVLNQSVTFTAQVLQSDSSAPSSGVVTFYDGAACSGTALGGPVPVNNVTGQASLSTAALTVGDHIVGACYTTSGWSGSSSSAMTQHVVTTPAISSISPVSGTAAGGTSIVITGSSFLGATGVKFGATPAADFTVNSNTQITATSPAGSGTVDVSVTGLAGTSTTSANDQFVYGNQLISVSNTFGSFNDTTVGNISSSQAYTVSGSNLTADIMVTVPNSDFQVSMSPGSGFGPSITLPQSGGSVSPTQIYVRFVPQATGIRSGNMSNASVGATTQFFSIGGLGIAASCAAQPSGIVAWYPGEGNGLDIRGGLNAASGTATFLSGKIGQGMSFGGGGDFLESTSTTLGSGLPLTIDGWVNASVRNDGTDFPSNTVSIDSPNDFGVGFGLNVWSAGSQLKIEYNDGFHTVTGVTFNPGDWYHIAVVYTSGEAKTYVNGVLIDDFTFSQGTANGPTTVKLGKHNDDAGAYGTRRFFKGQLDEVEIFNRALTGAEISGIYYASTAGQCFGPTTTSGISGWWPGSGDAKDISGNGNNGTLQNNAGFGFGKVGQAFSFNGINQYLLVADPIPAQLQIQNEISLEAWIYVTGLPTTGDELAMIMGSQRDATQSGASIFFDGRTNPDGQTAPPGHIHFQIGDGSGFHASNTNSTVPLNQWVHVVATRKANDDAKVYYNGVLQPLSSAPWSGSIAYTSAWFAIGQQKDVDRPFSGLIDEPTIYNRALTQNEVRSLFNAGVAGKYKSVSTVTGSNVSSNAGGDATVTFGSVAAGGNLQQVPIDGTRFPSLPQTAFGLYYDVSTTTNYTGGATVCFHLPLVSSSLTFNELRIDHLENGSWVDRTNLATPNFPARIICTTSLPSLSPFAIGVAVPTAAEVTIWGRVLTPEGAGLRNASVVMTASDGATRRVHTNAFGYYTFDGVLSGRIYIMGVESRRFLYPTRAVEVNETLTDIDFTPIE